jgi:hypothetical protein
MSRTIHLEFLRLASPRHTIPALLLAILALYLVVSGTLHYRRVLDEKRAFIAYEAGKVSQYVNYEQYGGQGLRVMYVPSPLSIYFEPRPITLSNIDTNEIIEISNTYKGKSFFFHSGHFKGFGHMVIFFGTLLTIALGMSAFQGKKGLAFYQYHRRTWITAGVRYLILQFFFILLFTAGYTVPRLMGVHFSLQDTLGYLALCGYASLILGISYSAGLLVLLKTLDDRNKTFRTGLTLWLLMVIVIPNGFREAVAFGANHITPNETVNQAKLQTAMDFERNALERFSSLEIASNKTKLNLARRLVNQYMETGFKKNKLIEDTLITQMENLATTISRISTLLPATTWDCLGESLSGRDILSYKHYVNHTRTIRDRFYAFYIDKRYSGTTGTIEPFIQHNENIFTGGAHLPKHFFHALGITLVYLLLLVIYIRKTPIPPTTDIDCAIPQIPINQLQTGNTYFVFCKNDTIKERLFYSIASKPGISGIDQIETTDFDMGIPPHHLLTYLCHQRNIQDPTTARALLNHMGTTAAPSLLKKIYCAAILAEDNDTIIINDFLKGMSKTFEQRFIDILCGPRLHSKKILYLSSEMYMSSAYIENQLEDDEKLEVYQVDIRKVSLR